MHFTKIVVRDQFFLPDIMHFVGLRDSKKNTRRIHPLLILCEFAQDVRCMVIGQKVFELDIEFFVLDSSLG